MELLNKKFNIIFLLFLIGISTVFGQERRNETVDARKYLPTLSFQEGGFMKTSEKNFPIPK